MKILILGGFLGAGKTSVLLQLAHYIVDGSKSESETKIAIIENEIGEIGIDDKILGTGDYSVTGLFAGCVCCSLTGSLVSALRDIEAKQNPDWVIIEATGVAYPAKIKEEVNRICDYPTGVACIVDAQRFKTLIKILAPMIEGQLEGADAVLINKIDKVDAEELDFVKKQLREYNADIKILSVSAKDGIDASVWEDILF